MSIYDNTGFNNDPYFSTKSYTIGRKTMYLIIANWSLCNILL